MESDLPGEDFFGYPSEFEKPGNGKLGRPAGIDAEALRRNVTAIQFAVDQNWGEVGWLLSQARTEADIRIAFKTIANPRCSQLDLFTTEPTECEESDLPELRKQIRAINKRHKDHLKMRRELQDASDRAFFALKSESDQMRRMQFLSTQATLIRDLEEVTKLAEKNRADYHELVAELAMREAYFAHSEILTYLENNRRRLGNRRRLTPRNIARAMAGLPRVTARVSDERCTREGINTPEGVMFEIFCKIRRHFKEPILNLGAAIDSFRTTIQNMREKKDPYASDLQRYLLILESAIRSAANDSDAPHGSFAFRVLKEFRKNTLSNGVLDYVWKATAISAKEDPDLTARHRWGG